MRGTIETITAFDIMEWCGHCDEGDRMGGYSIGPENRYFFDFNLGSRWSQYDTWHDAWYFGVWVNPTDRQVLQFVEGEIWLSTYSTPEEWDANLKRMAERYGEQPHIAVLIHEDGSITKVYNEDACHGR